MIKSRFTLPLGAAALTVAGTLLLAGCGKGDEQTTRFNTVLGDSAAPTSPGVIDRGILSDPANYKPAAKSGDLGAGGGGAPSGGGDVSADTALTPEQQAVVRSITVMTEDVFAMNAAGVMGAFDPAQIDALMKNDFESSLSNLFSAVDLTYKTIKSKLPPDQQAALTTVFSLAPKAVQVLSGRPRVELSEDGTTATVFNDPPSPDAVKAFVSANAAQIIEAARVIASSGWAPIDSEHVGMIESLTPETLPTMIEPMLEGLDAARAAAEAQGGAAAQGTKMKKVGDRWVIELPGTVNEEMADLLKEGVDLAREALTAMQAQIDAAPALNQELVQQISANLMTGTLPQFMGWFGRFQSMMMEMGGEAGEQPSATEPTGENPPVNPRQPSGGDGPINP